MKVKFKKLNSFAQNPQRANDSDAGFDLIATNKSFPSHSESGLYVEFGTGISLEIPKGYVGLLFPRSSISKTRHSLRNSVGVIDAGYRGEIKFRFTDDPTATGYNTGDKIGQIVFIKLPKIEMQESENLEDSSRGSKGFGSTGN
ncbi:MAG: dUTP diphosphatase [Flavobacteriia bacterium]|nr:dUTP diphosphatase [Flavobacteriia bacterium]